jgi:hypothetical protein
MKTVSLYRTLALAYFALAPLQAGLITNGGFESGLTGWTTADQVGSDGRFFSQTGTLSPANGFTVPAPPEGTRAAMTDSGAGGSHVLYQDFLVPLMVPGASVNFSLFINNGADAFFTPATLDFATPALNQQARVDILNLTSDVLLNLYQTQPGNPLISGYTPIVRDVTALLQAHVGETLRLRFAEVDNVSFFNLGVDAVDINVNAIPEPSTWMMTVGALFGAALFRRLNRR